MKTFITKCGRVLLDKTISNIDVLSEMSHLCLFTSSVPFFMLPSRLVRSCSHGGNYHGDGDVDGADGDNGADGADGDNMVKKTVIFFVIAV